MPLCDFAVQPGKTAKYLQLANWFENRIRAGEFAPGERLPSGRQLSRQLKLSPITTTAALNELDRRHLVVRRHGSGTFVASERELERRFRIGFLAPPTESTYVLRVLGSLWKNCGGECDLITLRRRPEEIEETVAGYGLDGLLLYNHNIPFELVRRLNASGIPALLVSSVMENASEFCVGYSNLWLIRDAVGYLAGLGHTRIGFITTSVDEVPTEGRYQGFLAAMWELRLPVNPEWLLVSPQADGQFSRYLARKERPTAVILGMRGLAAGFCRAVTDAGIRVPEELSVLCIDEPDDADRLRPPLSRFRIDVDGFSRQGVRQLLQRIRHEIPERSEERNYEFCDAGSCAPVPAD